MGRKIKIVTFIQMWNKHFCFFLPLVFMFDVVSSFFFSFLVWCPFFLHPSGFPQWLEVLKTLWMVCSVVIPNWDWGRKYDLWTSNPLIHCHQSWEWRLWIYQACFLSSGTARTRYHWWSFETWIFKQTPIICFIANN